MSKQTRKWTFRRILRTTWVTFGLSFTAWMFYTMHARGVDIDLMENSDGLIFENTSDYYAFTPRATYQEVFLFYPGALVQPKAYIPLCRKVAENGIQVYLFKMPWRQATRGYTKPLALDMFKDSSKTYILAGHSQGAKMAAQFVYENPSLVDKLILMGTTHPRDISLASFDLPILKIYGSKDGVASEQTLMNNKGKLPSHAAFIKIEGANHAQFGYYGPQLGDERATISREKQQAEILKHIMTFLDGQ